MRVNEQNNKETGWCEMGVYDDDKLVAVITRPIKGASWFMIPGEPFAPRQRFRSRKAALKAAGVNP